MRTLLIRLLIGLSVVLRRQVTAFTGDVKSTLVAEHSRKTFRAAEDDTIRNILKEMPKEPDPGVVNDVLRKYGNGFAESARAALEDDEDPDLFKKLWYDPAYKIHSICEPENSGGQTNKLEWTESGDRLLKIIGNGVVKDGYNMFMAPRQAQGKRTDVHVAVYIESMSSFKAQTMDFEMDIYLAMGWFDRRLAHNCTHPVLVTSKVIADRIWHPDLYFVNSKFAYLQEVTTPNMMVVVYPDGLVFKSMRVDVTLSCMLELRRFPMDFQECPITIQSYAYIENIVNLTWHVDHPHFPLGSNEDIKLNDMVIVKTRFETCSGAYPMFRGSSNWSCIRAFIVMKRLVLFHIIQTYIPTGMLVLISWISFFLDPRASPARITLTITSLLTLTTMSNGARLDLPQVSYIKALDIWLTFSQGLIFLVLLEYSFVSFYITRRVFDCDHRRYMCSKQVNNNGTGQHSKLLKCPNGATDDAYADDYHEGDDYRDTEPTTGESVQFTFDREPPPVAVIVDGNGALKDPGAPVERRADTALRKRKEKETFTVSQGLTQCMSDTAHIVRPGQAINRAVWGPEQVAQFRPRLASWVELEVETAALMSAAPHAAAHIYNKFDFTKPCAKCALHNEQIARRIDRYSRVAFPLVFVIFCVSYWLYYIIISHPHHMEAPDP